MHKLQLEKWKTKNKTKTKQKQKTKKQKQKKTKMWGAREILWKDQWWIYIYKYIYI